MRQNWLLVGTLLLVGGFALSGCAAGARPIIAMPIADSHIIFNPHWNTPALAGLDREQWPVALVSDERDPEVYFRETVTDRQGLSVRGRDYYYRRVESTRIRQSGR